MNNEQDRGCLMLKARCSLLIGGRLAFLRAPFPQSSLLLILLIQYGELYSVRAATATPNIP
jgi:hypothetical protein